MYYVVLKLCKKGEVRNFLVWFICCSNFGRSDSGSFEENERKGLSDFLFLSFEFEQNGHQFSKEIN